MRLRKTTGVPGAAPGGYTWQTSQEVVEVPDDLGTDLLGIRGAGFAEVAPEPEPDPAADDEGPAAEAPSAEATPAPRRPGRPRKTPVAE